VQSFAYLSFRDLLDPRLALVDNVHLALGWADRKRILPPQRRAWRGHPGSGTALGDRCDQTCGGAIVGALARVDAVIECEKGGVVRRRVPSVLPRLGPIAAASVAPCPRER